MEEYYTAREAMELLQLPNSTFHYLVRRGAITPIYLPLRTRALYRRDQIDQYAEARRRDSITPGRLLDDFSKRSTTFPLRFVPVTEDDLPQVMRLRASWLPREQAEVSAPTLCQYQAWLRHNPEAIHILKRDLTMEHARSEGVRARNQVASVGQTDVYGVLAMGPIRATTQERLLRQDITERELQPDDYLPVAPATGEPVEFFVACFTASETRSNDDLCRPAFATALTRSTLHYFLHLANRGVAVRSLTMLIYTELGMRLAAHLGAKDINTNMPLSRSVSECTMKGYTAHAVFDRPIACRCDLLATQADQPALRAYQRAYYNLRRRHSYRKTKASARGDSIEKAQ